MPRILIALMFLFTLGVQVQCAPAGEVIPPKPADRFTDYAGVVSATAAAEFNDTLRTCEQSSSNVVLVVVYPTMQSDSDIADYCTRVAHAWKPGSRETSNGVVLFIFIRDRKMHIATGYGMEGALPDAICERIIAEQIAPSFKQQDYEGGIRAGIGGIIAAAGGSYHPAAPSAPVAHHSSVDPQPPSVGLRIWQVCFCTFFVLAILYVLRAVVGAIIAIFASVLLAIFFHDKARRIARFARFLMWVETHAEVKTKTSSWVGGQSHSGRRGSGSYYSVLGGSFSLLGTFSGGGGSFATGGDFGGGGASGSW